MNRDCEGAHPDWPNYASRQTQKANNVVLTVDISDVRRCFEALMHALSTNHAGSNIVLTRDFYWALTADQSLDVSDEVPTPGLASLVDDAAEIVAWTNKPDELVLHTATHLAGLLVGLASQSRPSLSS